MKARTDTTRTTTKKTSTTSVTGRGSGLWRNGSLQEFGKSRKELTARAVGGIQINKQEFLSYPVGPDGKIIFNIGPFTTMKIYPIALLFVNVGSKFC